MDRNRIEYWPAHLQSVFAVVGKSMGDRRLVPDVLNCIPRARGGILPGHAVAVTYVPGKRPGPRSGHYLVGIAGPRINARWRFRSSELEKLSRSVARAVAPRSPPHGGQYELGAEVW
jgi:hypothetical protein